MPDPLITSAEAAEILDVSVRTVGTLTASGVLHSYGRSGPGVGSLRPEEVRNVARERQQRQRAARQRSRTVRGAGASRPKPPDDRYEWLTTTQVASMFGVTRQAIVNRCRRETLPFEWKDGQRWLRRDLLNDADSTSAA